ncbi:MAG TPA: hypothetical protein VN740_05575 [Solirubrobacteraceae bacterium]|nr:hypothetical protein [Solirubrobacteraceae bacterium]
MRRAPLLLAIAALALGGGAASASGVGLRAHAAAPGSHLQVNLVEYRLMLSEAVVKAGPVDLEAIDAGMDPHDLRLRYGRSATVIAEPALQSGQRWDGVVVLRPGVYHLWCSLATHWRLGMHATLRVVR